MADSSHSYRVVIGQQGAYAHTFGHDPGLLGLAPEGGTKAAHLVLSLDMSDPQLAHFCIGVGPILRLVHPYHYSQGQTFAYRHVPNGIAFDPPLDVEACEPSWPAKDYPATFPTENAELVTGVPDPDDFNIDKIFISETQPTPQEDSGGACESCGVRPLTLFAVIPSTPLPNLRLWGEYGDGVVTIFCYCHACHAINTSNSCD